MSNTQPHPAPAAADRLMAVFSWGRISFLVILALAGFGTFVAGEVSGARTLEPRVVILEKKVDAVIEEFEDRGKTLYEIKGYVKAIAAQMGVPPALAPVEAQQ